MRAILFLCFSLLAGLAQSNMLDDWQGSNESSLQQVDHSVWQSFLNEYLLRDDFGQTYFSYGKVSSKDKQHLSAYIGELEQVDPLQLNSQEQKAYWINLYNAVTVQVVLDNYPLESIRDIGTGLTKLLKRGPWDDLLTIVNGTKLSLNNIEHDIVRPKFQDYRIHFALNCAAKGCPNLSQTAFTGANIEQLLNEAERTFVNHQRGVRIQNGKLIVSKIFSWYLQDFVTDEDELPAFLAQFANSKLRAQLKGYRGGIKYEYDWALNEVMKP